MYFKNNKMKSTKKNVKYLYVYTINGFFHVIKNRNNRKNKKNRKNRKKLIIVKEI